MLAQSQRRMLTPAATAWIAEHLPADAIFCTDRVVIDHRLLAARRRCGQSTAHGRKHSRWGLSFREDTECTSMRHTFCSHLAMRGAPARAIQELAGYQDVATTQRYRHLSPAAAHDAAIKLLDGQTIVACQG